MKHTFVVCAALLTGFASGVSPVQAATSRRAVVLQALDRLDKAPHYRIDTTTVIGGEVSEYILDYVAPNRTHYRSSNSEAITIGSTYYDRYEGGPWNVSTISPNSQTLGETSFDASEILNVLPLGKGKLKAKRCDIYAVGLRGGTQVQICIDPVKGLPLIIDIDSDLEGSSVQEFDYDVPLSIKAPL